MDGSLAEKLESFNEEHGRWQGWLRQNHHRVEGHSWSWHMQMLCGCVSDPEAKSEGEELNSGEIWLWNQTLLKFLPILPLWHQGNNHTHYHDDNLLYTVMNLFAAGTDTTATTINWCLLFMAKYPHIQGEKDSWSTLSQVTKSEDLTSFFHYVMLIQNGSRKS